MSKKNVPMMAIVVAVFLSLGSFVGASEATQLSVSSEVKKSASDYKLSRATRISQQKTFQRVHGTECNEEIQVASEDVNVPEIRARLEAIQSFLSAQRCTGQGYKDFWVRNFQMNFLQGKIAYSEISKVARFSMNDLLAATIENLNSNLSKNLYRDVNKQGDAAFWKEATQNVINSMSKANSDIEAIIKVLPAGPKVSEQTLVKYQLQVVEAWLGSQNFSGASDRDSMIKTYEVIWCQIANASRIIRNLKNKFSNLQQPYKLVLDSTCSSLEALSPSFNMSQGDSKYWSSAAYEICRGSSRLSSEIEKVIKSL
ncbi:MAG: hypothetical protein HQM10_12580 [Candidatus Riflebacteria bacterium]|nr:hypothetical protein [Candidatus Riflebacteria bacterium]